MDLEWVLSYPEGVEAVECSATELELRSRWGRVVLRRLPPPILASLLRLAGDGERAGAVAAYVHRTGGAAQLFHLLRELTASGLLCISVGDPGQPLATAIPIAPGFVPRSDDLTDRRYLLSRFACMRRSDVGLVLESPLAGARVELRDERAVQLVAALASPLSPRELPEARPLLRLLFACGLTTTLGESGAPAEDESPVLRPWSFHDLLFHSRSREGRHADPMGATYHLVGVTPPPPIVRPPGGGDTIELPRPALENLERDDPPFAAVVERRRSIRDYGAEPMTLDQLGAFLFRVGRIKGTYEIDLDSASGLRMELTARPYPASGGMYEMELYPVVRACAGLERGLYHYDAVAHRLGLLAAWSPEVDHLLQGAAAAAGLDPPDSVQVLIVLAARFQRVSWKYSGIAYALTLKNVGVLYQTMYLTATAMGLAPCALGCGNSDLFARLLGSDYCAETSVGEFLLGSAPPD